MRSWDRIPLRWDPRDELADLTDHPPKITRRKIVLIVLIVGALGLVRAGTALIAAGLLFGLGESYIGYSLGTYYVIFNIVVGLFLVSLGFYCLVRYRQSHKQFATEK